MRKPKISVHERHSQRAGGDREGMKGQRKKGGGERGEKWGKVIGEDRKRRKEKRRCRNMKEKEREEDERGR